MLLGSGESLLRLENISRSEVVFTVILQDHNVHCFSSRQVDNQ